jgi:hypothetical protein
VGEADERSAIDKRAWLREQRGIFEQRRTVAAGREGRWSWARLGTFVIIVLPWLVLGAHPLVALVVSVVGIVLFAWTVLRHLRALAEREALDRLLTMVDEALQRCGGAVVCIRDWERPHDDSEEDAVLPAMLAPEHTWSLTDQERDDLDLFSGPVGIFGLLNRTSAAMGARRLRDRLENPSVKPAEIREAQATVRWLAEHSEQRLRLMASLAALRPEAQRLAKLIRAVAAAQPFALSLPSWLLWAWPAATMVLLIAAIAATAGGDFRLFGWLLLVMAVNVGLLRRWRQLLDAGLKLWQDVSWAVRALAVGVRQAAEDLPTDTGLARLRGCCAGVETRGVLPRLRWRLAWTEQGGPMHVVMNALVLLDAQVARAIAACVVPQRERLLCAISALAELDALCSLAAFAWEQPRTCFGEPLAEGGLEVTEGEHPLVPPERVVANSVTLHPERRMWVVTGSNMAGKSTFLRMVGLNTLLAQMGTTATARAMRWAPVRLITDLRARDNLAADESYFLAEVRHLRRMIQPAAGSAPLLGLIDEPFRGTNSEDQSAASVAVLGYLLRAGHFILVATHDRHLTALGEGPDAANFHFRENLSSGTPVFDYRLHDGPAQTRNALRILEREGYPAELVARAYGWMEQDSPAGDAREP